MLSLGWLQEAMITEQQFYSLCPILQSSIKKNGSWTHRMVLGLEGVFTSMERWLF